MTIGKMINIFAGCMVLLSVLLTQFHHENWMWFTVFIGFNLIQSSFTGFCLPAIVLRKLGAKPGTAF